MRTASTLCLPCLRARSLARRSVCRGGAEPRRQSLVGCERAVRAHARAAWAARAAHARTANEAVVRGRGGRGRRRLLDRRLLGSGLLRRHHRGRAHRRAGHGGAREGRGAGDAESKGERAEHDYGLESAIPRFTVEIGRNAGDKLAAR